MANEILVIIPPQQYDDGVFADNYNCYLSQALRVDGYKDVETFLDEVRIGRQMFKIRCGARRGVTIDLLKRNFAAQRDTLVYLS